MAIKFQYNKTSLGELGKQLTMRQKALPTIKSKESALRLEVKKAKAVASDYERRLSDLSAQYDYMVALWGEFDPELLTVEDVLRCSRSWQRWVSSRRSPSGKAACSISPARRLLRR